MTYNKFLVIFIVLLLLFVLILVKKKHEDDNLFEINWQYGDWSYQCTFLGNNLLHVSSSNFNCSKRCMSFKGCTHYTWSAGVCSLKSGSVNKSEAVIEKHKTTLCGLVTREIKKTNLEKFTKCSFSYGRDFSGSGPDTSSYHSFDYITIWLGLVKSGCHNKPSCTRFNENYHGLMLKKTMELKKVPVFYSYIIGFEGHNLGSLNECNEKSRSLCEKGANFIRNNYNLLLWRYAKNSQHIAQVIGKQAFCVFLIEPNFWDYHGAAIQKNALTGQEMRQLFEDIVSAIKKYLPNAAISWDINSRLSESGMRSWWSFFENSTSIDFIHTSEGDANAESVRISVGGELTWSFMRKLTGKKIIANSAFVHDLHQEENRLSWYNPQAIKQRAADGVISISFHGVTKAVRTYREDVCGRMTNESSIISYST